MIFFGKIGEFLDIEKNFSCIWKTGINVKGYKAHSDNKR